MKHLALLAIVVLCPAAHAQDDHVEGRKLAEAFSQADLDALGRCQARVEGAGLILQDMESWLIAQNQTEVLQSLRNQVEKGVGPIEAFSEVRQQTSTAKGMKLADSDAAHARMLETFKRLPGEDERALYARAHSETQLPQECRDALKRGRWKVEIDSLGEDQ